MIIGNDFKKIGQILIFSSFLIHVNLIMSTINNFVKDISFLNSICSLRMMMNSFRNEFDTGSDLSLSMLILIIFIVGTKLKRINRFKQLFKNKFISFIKMSGMSKRILYALKIISVFIIIIPICKGQQFEKHKKHIHYESENISISMKLRKTRKLLNLPRLWSRDFLWGMSLGCKNETIELGKSYENENISISQCYFSRMLESSSKGGVIYVVGGSFSMNIIYSMFFRCIANSYGAIYFSSHNSCLRMICANSCSATVYNHFAHIKASQVNQVEYLSVSNCSHTTSGDYSIGLNFGDPRVDNTNSSMNNAIQGSGIHIYYTTSFISTHCTFSNNNVSSNKCLFFSRNQGTISMSYANIVHNTSPSLGVVYCDGSGSNKMMYCIFHSNQIYLFCVYSGSLEVSHSFIYHSELNFSTSKPVLTTTNNSITHKMTYQFQFFNSLQCNADNPLLQRTLDQSPIKSFEKTLKMTDERTTSPTMENTPINTFKETPINTFKETPINTFKETPINTVKETPYRSYIECIFTLPKANKREINVIFSFSFIYPAIIQFIS